MKELYTFEDFCNIIETLLGENGCPWDKAQTHATLMPHLLEECYEAIDAQTQNDTSGFSEELGDVLLQIVLNSKIAENNNSFSMDDVITGISKKMITRHPHIFGDAKVDSANEVLQNWETIKKTEKGYQDTTDILRRIPKALPALLRTYKVQKQIQKSNVTIDSVTSSVNQEIAHLTSLLTDLSSQNLTETPDTTQLIGQMLFTMVSISRKLQINPEFALTNALEQFINRFEYVENESVSLAAASTEYAEQN